MDIMNDFTNTFHIHVGSWNDISERAMQVRMMVFVKEQGVPVALERDSFDLVSQHVLAFDRNGKTIGTGRLLHDGHIGRMAVLPEWRGKGVGTALLGKLIETAEAHGVQKLALNAQLGAVAFYARFGFLPVGSEFIEAGILHITMIRHLTMAKPL
jgi:predicted GNAT family N-acyltransferase